jgi:hypothetical protein
VCFACPRAIPGRIMPAEAMIPATSIPGFTFPPCVAGSSLPAKR